MLPVVQTKEQFKNALDEINGSPCIAVPVYSDINVHPRFNSLSVLFVFLSSSEKFFIFPFNHNEAINLPAECLNYFNPMQMMAEHTNELLYFIKNGKLVNYQNGHTSTPKIIDDMHLKFNSIRHINRYVPMMKLLEYAQAVKDKISNNFDPLTYSSISDYVIIPTLHAIEKSGLKVNEQELIKHFGQRVTKYITDGFVYSKYNTNTTTGRPSNSYGGINFAALNKHDETRKSFISRFKNGELVLIDFESFHLRLIAEMINYPQPTIPFHEYLGRLYYNTTALTPEQYDKGKQTTFSYLYGDAKSKIKIPYFEKISNLVDGMWDVSKRQGVLELPTGIEVNIDENMNKQKLFNYLIQAEETVVALSLIMKLLPMYENAQSKIILYTYDSVLIDHNIDEGEDIINNTKTVLEASGRFPTRLYRGFNYHEIS